MSDNNEMGKDGWSWKDAREWQALANKDKEEFKEPTWSWDCNFKLDFDGPIMSVNSRFYPTSLNSFITVWEGELDIYILNKLIVSKKFSNNDLNSTKDKAQEYINKFANRLKHFSNFPL